MNKALIFLSFLFITACAPSPTPDYKSVDFISKDAGVVSATATESQPFVLNGRLYLAVWERVLSTKRLDIYDYRTREKLHSIDTNFQFGCILVIENQLYLYGSEVDETGWSLHGNGIYMTSTKDFTTWSESYLVIEAPANERLYNMSVTHDAQTGWLVMVYEFSRPGYKDFSFRFARSASPNSGWTNVGQVFSPMEYAGCPTLRYSDGLYQLMYLRARAGEHLTYIATGETLDSLTEGKVVIAADGDEGTNNSDLDLVEFEGKTYFSYAIGDQKNWTGIKTATFGGSMGTFFERMGL